jgi:hypothetical protein
MGPIEVQEGDEETVGVTLIRAGVVPNFLTAVPIMITPSLRSSWNKFQRNISMNRPFEVSFRHLALSAKLRCSLINVWLLSNMRIMGALAEPTIVLR